VGFRDVDTKTMISRYEKHSFWFIPCSDIRMTAAVQEHKLLFESDSSGTL